MIKNSTTKRSLIKFLIISVVINMAIFALFLSNVYRAQFFTDSSNQLSSHQRIFKIDKINIGTKPDAEKIRKVGIKNGIKNLNQPDIIIKNLAQINSENVLKNESLDFPLRGSNALPITSSPTNSPTDDNQFFIDPKKNLSFSKSNEHEHIKKHTINNLNVPQNKIQQSISGLEVRMERPEGVNEDELNDIEKMYYSFNVRMYKKFYTTIITTFEKIRIQKPGLEKAMADKHELIGRVEYDENGDIQSIKILKSSINDDVHYFFEESLKQLRLPNPPKTKMGKDKIFNIYYSITIN